MERSHNLGLYDMLVACEVVGREGMITEGHFEFHLKSLNHSLHLAEFGSKFAKHNAFVSTSLEFKDH